MVHKKIITICMVFLAAGAVLYAGCRHPGHEDRAQRIAAYLADELSLTADQQAVLDRITGKWHAKQEEMQSTRKQIVDEVLARFGSDRFDSEFLSGRIAVMKPHAEEMAALFAEGVAEFHSVLTPAQRAKFVAKLEDWKKIHQYVHD